MKYLFDSSAIFKAIKENKVDLLIGNHTLELARYELGNILWKIFKLQAKATEQEIKSLTKIIKQAFAVQFQNTQLPTQLYLQITVRF
jgi:predicted nucleic acid-binding protein